MSTLTLKQFMLVLLAAAVAIVGPLWQLLHDKWPKYGDYVIHATVMRNVSQQLWAGEFYPRWLTAANSGLGAMDFIFQPPLHNLAGALFGFLSGVDRFGFARVLVVATLFVFLGGVGCYLWLREELEERQARVGALVYMGCPFLVNMLYLGQNVPSVSGWMVLPFMLFAAVRLARVGAAGMPLYACAQAALVFAHLLSTVMFSAVPLVYAVVVARPGQRVRMALTVAIAAALGIALSAIYWLPAAQNRAFIFVQRFTQGPFDYRTHFVNAHYGGSVIMAMVVPLVLCWWLVRKDAFAQNRVRMLYWMAVMGGAIFMSLAVSRPLWELFPILENLQYPHRFFMLCAPAAAFLVANWQPQLRGATVHAAIIVMWMFQAWDFTSGFNYSYRLSSSMHQVLSHQIIGEYYLMTTSWMRKAGIRDTRAMPSRFYNVPLVQQVNGQAQITQLKQDSRAFTFHAKVDSPSASIALKRFYYPGWKVVSPAGAKLGVFDALIGVRLAQGEYDVELRQDWVPGEKDGYRVSGTALALVLAGIWGTRFAQRNLLVGPDDVRSAS